MSNFSRNLITLRKSKNLSLVELTKQLNSKYEVKFSKASIDRWEKGLTSPSVTHASALAHYFNVTLDELSGISDLSDKKELKQDTLAAHLDGDYTEEELAKIREYADMVRKSRDR
ncbi:helix-turn-helix domain-containing protein [Staphylococcus rostri]